MPLATIGATMSDADVESLREVDRPRGWAALDDVPVTDTAGRPWVPVDGDGRVTGVREVRDAAGRRLVSRDRRHLFSEARATIDGVDVVLVCDGARAVPWPLDLADVARRIRICERFRCLRERPDGGWDVVSLGCGLRICPVCARARAAKMAARWKPVYQAAADDGAELRFWTLTHETRVADGGLVTGSEADRYGWRGVEPRWFADWRGRSAEWVDGAIEAAGPEIRDVVGRWGSGEPLLTERAWWSVEDQALIVAAVGGESLRDAYERFRTRFRSTRQDRSVRHVVRDAWGGYHYGIEWTGREPRTGRPRWHAHGHVLTVTPQPVSQSDVDAILSAWCSRAGKGDAIWRGQYCSIVKPEQIGEVLKYPFKPGGCTQAGRISILGESRGKRPQQAAGAWSPRDKRHVKDPWRTWLSFLQEPEVRRRLHYHPPDGDPNEPPRLWTGGLSHQEAAAIVTWALRDPAEPSGWRRWREPAVSYLRELGRPTRESELPEPGSDTQEDTDDDGD